MLKLSDDFIKEDIIKLQSLHIEGLNDYESCQIFVYVICHLSLHRDRWRRFITPSKKPTHSIKDTLKNIGYVHNKKVYLPNLKLSSYSGFTKNKEPWGFGKGTFFYRHWWSIRGSRYVGNWKEGKPDGFGIFTFANGNRYEGDWKKGRKSGFGILTFVNGDRYVGDWKKGKKSGFGVFTFVNGDRYKGDWKNDKRTGYAVITWAGNVTLNEGQGKNRIFSQARPAVDIITQNKLSFEVVQQKMEIYLKEHLDAEKNTKSNERSILVTFL